MIIRYEQDIPELEGKGIIGYTSGVFDLHTKVFHRYDVQKL